MSNSEINLKYLKEPGKTARIIDGSINTHPPMNRIKDLIPTRQSLLSQLQTKVQEESWNKGWKRFFETYWRLIYQVAVKAGLNDDEAQDVVQETVISVMKKMPEFKYDPQKGSFKGWLLKLTGWRIKDQLRKRQQNIEPKLPNKRTHTRTETVERMPDPNEPALEKAWDEEWQLNLLEAAVERVKRKVDAKQFQVFDLYAVKKWPVTKVARLLQMNPARVYLTKHRVGAMIKKEITFLQTRPV